MAACGQLKDIILNNKAVTILSIVLFAFVISTIALAGSNQRKKNAIRQCEADLINSKKPQCLVNITSDLPDREPVYLRIANGLNELWYPEGPLLEWTRSSLDFSLLCAGTGNTVLDGANDLASGQCGSDGKFKIGDKSYEAKDLTCKSEVDGDFQNLGTCAEGRGISYQLGFKTVFGNRFITYFDACFHSDTQSLLYTKHIIPSGAQQTTVTVDNAVWKKGDLVPDFDAIYKQADQKTRLTALLGSEEEANKYLIQDVQYLSKGHMTPKGDGVFRSWKRASFFYMNAVPQWKTVNEGNWNEVEKLSRWISAVLKEDLDSYQGSGVEVMTLPDKDKKQQPLSLADKVAQVPLWHWKIIKSTKLDAGIAFVTLNNPFVAKLDDLRPPCLKNICTKTGWAKAEFTNFTQGYTQCCDPNEILRFVPHAPYEAMVRNVLTSGMVMDSGAEALARGLKLALLMVIVLVFR
ncbi:uncharacterized protein LOC129747459 [Uranotaenia lowii]|uniref:uncharacterized protein LOC129747459 n=1 Tax=Uranotaenia lowii TaxID=190385 RepID=UPI002479A88C|nr:uncharacterized protein LOC129747459 [Uranotaenia lowii]